jgi:hypothetical protein
MSIYVAEQHGSHHARTCGTELEGVMKAGVDSVVAPGAGPSMGVEATRKLVMGKSW